jgi:hypothetical protein
MEMPQGNPFVQIMHADKNVDIKPSRKCGPGISILNVQSGECDAQPG